VQAEGGKQILLAKRIPVDRKEDRKTDTGEKREKVTGISGGEVLKEEGER